MPTGDKVTNIFVKKLLSKTDLGDRLVQYLTTRIDDIVAGLFAGQAGVLDTDQITVAVGASNDQFTLGLSQANRVVTGGGNIVTIPSGVAGETTNVPFENTALEVYSLGIRYAQVVTQEVQTNPSTGKPNYPAQEESFGEVGAPASVVDDPGVNIHLVLDNLLENGVDHSGQKVVVYLVVPVAQTVAVAFFEGTVTYHGGSGENRVVIPYSGSSGPLGQDTSADPPSTTAADYVVHVKGASWFKESNKDLRNDTNYAFIARATGGSPPSFDLADQQPVFQQSLDRAYDGQFGAGSGRTMNVDAGAMRVRNPNTSNDTYGATVSMEAIEETEDNKILQQAIGGGRPSSGIYAALMVLSDPSDVQKSEGCAFTNPDEVVFTRGGMLIPASNFLLAGQDLLRISSSPTDDGLYLINARTSNFTVQVRHLDGSVPNLVHNDAGIGTFLRPQLVVGGQVTAATPQQGVTVAGDNVTTGGAAFNVQKGHRPQAVKLYDAAGNVVVDTEADTLRTQQHVAEDPEGGGSNYAWAMKVDNAVVGKDQLLLVRKATPDVLAALIDDSGNSRVKLSLTRQGPDGSGRLGVGDEVFLGIEDARDVGSDVGMLVKRSTGNDEEAFLVELGTINAPGEGVLQVYCGRDNPTDESVRVFGAPFRADAIKVYDPAATTDQMVIGDASTNRVLVQGEDIELHSSDDLHVNADDDVNITADANAGGAGDVIITGQAVRQRLTDPVTENIIVPLAYGNPDLGGDGYWSASDDNYGAPHFTNGGLILSSVLPHLCTINYIELPLKFSGVPSSIFYLYTRRYTFGSADNVLIDTRSYTSGSTGYRNVRVPASGSFTGMSNISRAADIIYVSFQNSSNVFVGIFPCARVNVTYDKLTPWPGMG